MCTGMYAEQKQVQQVWLCTGVEDILADAWSLSLIGGG